MNFFSSMLTAASVWFYLVALANEGRGDHAIIATVLLVGAVVILALSKQPPDLPRRHDDPIPTPPVANDDDGLGMPEGLQCSYCGTVNRPRSTACSECETPL